MRERRLINRLIHQTVDKFQCHYRLLVDDDNGENLLPLDRVASTEGQTARMPAVVSVSTSSSTISQPCDAAYEQAALNSGIFQSPTSEVSAISSRAQRACRGVSVTPVWRTRCH